MLPSKPISPLTPGSPMSPSSPLFPINPRGCKEKILCQIHCVF